MAPPGSAALDLHGVVLHHQFGIVSAYQAADIIFNFHGAQVQHFLEWIVWGKRSVKNFQKMFSNICFNS